MGSGTFDEEPAVASFKLSIATDTRHSHQLLTSTDFHCGLWLSEVSEDEVSGKTEYHGTVLRSKTYDFGLLFIIPAPAGDVTGDQNCL